MRGQWVKYWEGSLTHAMLADISFGFDFLRHAVLTWCIHITLWKIRLPRGNVIWKTDVIEKN